MKEKLENGQRATFPSQSEKDEVNSYNFCIENLKRIEM